MLRRLAATFLALAMTAWAAQVSAPTMAQQPGTTTKPTTKPQAKPAPKPADGKQTKKLFNASVDNSLNVDPDPNDSSTTLETSN